jgi:multidrug efflux pump subunit AcrA (membrane-fusion protein)
VAALSGGGTPTSVRAPISGRIAELSVVPGQAVEAGAPLARIVRTNPLWVEVSLAPSDAGAIGGSVPGLVLHPPGGQNPITVRGGEVRLVSRAPELDRATGASLVLFEIRTNHPLQPGMAVTVDVLLPQEVSGIVLPSTAVVDDGGVPVVYVQLDGEGFVRQEVRVLATEGDRVAVEGLAEWSRVVTLGGATIRRAALLRSGPPEGHVH